jgi:hypothetical protein
VIGYRPLIRQFTPTAIRFQFVPYENATHSTQPVPFELMLIIAPSTWLALSQGLRERCHNRELSRLKCRASPLLICPTSDESLCP